MGILKKAPYDKKMLEVAEIAKALGHPARIKMFHYLRENSTGNNPLFQGITTLSKTAVSQHIHQLQRAGLVISILPRQDRFTIYQRKPTTVFPNCRN